MKKPDLEVIRINESAEMVDAHLGKKYKLASSENFDEFMKALGVGLVTRKVGNAVSPVVELTKNDDEYTLSSSSTFKNVVLKFKPGVEFDQDTPDGRKVKATITVDGNTLHEVQKDPNSGKETVIDRTFTDDEVKMVMSVDNITATRIYKIQA
ncbi:fatty acid-binding protein, adipocyte isoform X2 [Tribolium madens]|uniref:fatty acid-binding protein, adipocyte isoform X2 n=1 Tax=Tribolium madens TaxID=41895 RepID=UPI001CF766F8|nr:fatty acid-binding protein, adipocyte isoform X2 [Tribolium madens]